MNPRPIAWTINTSDSASGDGAQSDLLTFHDFGAHGCSVLTAVAARNSIQIDRSVQLGPDVVEAQIRALAKDLPARALKTGALGMTGIIRAVARYMEQIDAPLVCDPCAASSAGMRLLDPSALETLRNKLLPRASVFTPNLAEAEWFSGLTGLSLETIPEAARRLLGMGAASVLVKGGHLAGEFAPDFWTDGEHTFWMSCPRLADPVPGGAGGVLSAAIAACLASSPAVADALVLAKAYTRGALRLRQPLGKGPGLPDHTGFPAQASDFPRAGSAPGDLFRAGSFEPLDAGVPPRMACAASAEEAGALFAAGVKTLRLTLAGIAPDRRDAEVTAAVRASSERGGAVFVDGAPDLALARGAHGVVLVPDAVTESLADKLHRAGLRLGIHVQSAFDLARALAWRPSFVLLSGTDGAGLHARLAPLADVPVRIGG